MESISTPIDTLRLPPQRRRLHIERTKPGPPQRLTMLVYGAPGSGKTTFASSFPKPFYIDVQGGLMSVRAKELPYYKPMSYDDAVQCTIVENLPEDCETVVLDTITHTVMMIMDGVMAQSKRDLPTLGEWSATIEYTKRLVFALLALPKHIVVTAEEAIDKDEDTGKILGGPDVPPSLRQKLPAMFDCVFHLRLGFNAATGKKGRWLLTEPEGMFFARDRLGGLDKLEVPEFSHLWSKVTT